MSKTELKAAIRFADGAEYAGVRSRLSMVRRIAKIVREAGPEARQAGSHWYPRIAALLQRIADHYGLGFDTVAGVFAVTSPRVSVTRNVWLTLAACAAHSEGRDVSRLPGLSDRLQAAARVLSGDLGGLELDGEGTLTPARKVRSFWANLSGETTPVTVDVWAARVAGSTLDQPVGGGYVAIAEAYRRAGQVLGISPREVQAVAWCAFRQEADGTDALAELADLEGLVELWIETV